MATIEQLAERANINRKKLADLRRMFGDEGVQHLLSSNKGQSVKSSVERLIQEIGKGGNVQDRIFEALANDYGDDIATKLIRLIRSNEADSKSIWFTETTKHKSDDTYNFWEQFTTKDHS